jgi:hypothetical protein
MIFTKRFQPEVLEIWHAFFDGFQMSSLEFYGMVKQELARRKVPGLTMSEVKWKEGWVLSDERTYLRLTRERWVFDICAAPFGTGFFFSYRFTELPIKISVLAVVFFLGVVAAIPIGAFYAFRMFPVVRAVDNLSANLLLLLTIVLILLILVRVIRSGLRDPDSMLLQLPGIGPVYDRYFRTHTYYREDTRLMYLATVPAIVKSLTEKVTVANGVKETNAPGPKPVLEALSHAR